MGLGLYTKASLVVGKPGLPLQPRPLAVDELQNTCAEFVTETPLGALASIDRLWDGKPGFSLTMHPAEEGMDFHVEGTEVFVSAKTSSAGPGYHAFAVSLLDHLQKTLGLAWHFGGDNEEFQDETGYYTDRDFGRLQDAFAKFMAQLFRMCLDKRAEGSQGFRLAMPLEFEVILPEKERIGTGAFTQLGPLGWIDLEHGASAKLKERDAVAERYFPWWEQGFGADFHAKLALLDMWMHVPWTAPVDDKDRAAMHQVLDWIDTARKLEPKRVLPDIAIAELRRLARSTDAPVLAGPGPIGYRRHLMSRPITGHWRVNVPGCLSEVDQPDSGRVIYALTNFEVHGSSFRLTLMDDKPVPTDAEQGEALFTQSSLRGSIDFKASDEGDGFSMTAVANTPVENRMHERGIVTVWFPDEALKPLAEQVLRSLRYDPPRQT